MDVGNPSNFERIRALYGGDLEALRADLAGARFTDDEVMAAIGAVHEQHGYLLDPHTAVGWLAIQSLRSEYPLEPGIVLATAHPAKFPVAVEAAIGSAIELPAALVEPMALPEAMIEIQADYEALRALLLVP